MTTGKQYIICKSHQYGKWIYADKADEQGRWNRSRTCAICAHTETAEVPVNPDAAEITGIEITGYQIRYSVKKNMKKAKTRTVKSAKHGP